MQTMGLVAIFLSVALTLIAAAYLLNRLIRWAPRSPGGRRQVSAAAPRARRICRVLASCIMFYGGLAFMVQWSAAAWGGPSFLGPSFEWPVGLATGVVQAPQGWFVVPLHNVGRLQIYDKNSKFLRGWWVTGRGGHLYVQVTKQGTIDMFSFKSRQKCLYSMQGQLLAQSAYEPHEGFEREWGGSFSRVFPTPWVLFWPFTNPFLGCGLILLGGLFGVFSDKLISIYTVGKRGSERWVD